jgi:hypothetical protein
MKFYIVASSWFFHSHITRMHGYTIPKLVSVREKRLISLQLRVRAGFYSSISKMHAYLAFLLFNKIKLKATNPFYFGVFCLLHQGPEPRALVALQPLGLLYALFCRSSHCRHQMSTRPTRRERSKQREGEL